MFDKIIKLLFIILFFAARLQAETILITANPPLPVPNFMNNPGFEEQVEFDRVIAYWDLNGVDEDDGLTDKAAHSGKYSFKFTGKRGINKSIRQRSVGAKTAPFPLKNGMTLVSGAWSKSVGAIPGGGAYGLSVKAGAYRPSPSFDKGTHDWAFSEKIFVLDKDIQALDALYACYYDQEGAVYYDDLYVSYATVQLNVKVLSPDLKQVCLYDNEDRKIFDSGILPRGTNDYTRMEKVRAQKTYYVEAEDYTGKVHVRNYPVLGRKVDLLNLYKEGKIKIDSNMNLTRKEFPGMGAAGVFDGLIEYGNGSYEGNDANSFFTVKLDRAYKIARIGICLKPRSVESAELFVFGNNTWRKIKDYSYASMQSVNYIYLNPSEVVEAVKVSITNGAGLKALTELELYEESE